MIDPFLVEILDKQDQLAEEIKVVAAACISVIDVLNAVTRKLKLDYEQIQKQIAETNGSGQNSEGERVRSEDPRPLLGDSGQLDPGVSDPEDDRTFARDAIAEQLGTTNQA